MIYFALLFGVVIAVTLIFVLFIFQLFVDKIWVVFPSTESLVVERAYRARDFVTSFRYVRKEDVMKEGEFYHIVNTHKIVHDDKHKKGMIEDHIYQLAMQMLDNNCIEIRELEYPITSNPFERQVELRVKVYQPE